jgi:hypothetical protein
MSWQPLTSRIHDAVKAAGDRGVSRGEIYRLGGNNHHRSEVDEALALLTRKHGYEALTVPTGGRPATRYRIPCEVSA